MGEEINEESLSDIFNSCQAILDELNDTVLQSNSSEYQDLVKKGISKGERATHQVNQLALFSSNEHYDEVPTADIKYLLIPAYLGHLCGLISGADRLNGLDRAEVYYKDFLSRCRSYEIPGLPSEDEKVPADPGALRSYRIRELTRRKDLESRESELRQLLEKETTDSDTARELYLVRLQKWALGALKEIKNIEEERPLLQRYLNREKNPEQASEPKPRASQLPPAMIITRDKLQQAVYGAGYPSLPVYTIEDFYKQRFAGRQQHSHHPEEPIPPPESDDQEESDEALARARHFDDWKDDHRRGCGNRYNMG